jgi:hypothetical protein
VEKRISNESGSDRKPDLSRRSILLGGTTIAAASAVSSASWVKMAQAQLFTWRLIL